eukprot:g17410.t1
MKVMDADGDGVITKSELDQLKAANPELSQVDMSKLDADGDGQISKEELEKALDAEVEPQVLQLRWQSSPELEAQLRPKLRASCRLWRTFLGPPRSPHQLPKQKRCQRHCLQ